MRKKTGGVSEYWDEIGEGVNIGGREGVVRGGRVATVETEEKNKNDNNNKTPNPCTLIRNSISVLTSTNPLRY